MNMEQINALLARMYETDMRIRDLTLEAYGVRTTPEERAQKLAQAAALEDQMLNDIDTYEVEKGA